MNKIQQVGIIGSGKMGSDIFNYLSEFNFQILWYTRNSEHKEVLHDTFRKKVNRQLKHGIISKDIFDLRTNYRITDNLNDLSECDLIIETVIEDPLIKIEIFKKLDQITKPSCILTSNSSSILPLILGQELSRKNRLAGMHFFYPVAFKNIIELIYSDFTDEITRDSIRLFSETIKKFNIELDEKNAFILNRFLLEIQLKALELVKKYNLDYNQIDSIAKQLIPDFGLFEMMDQVGHNTMYNAIMNYSLMDSNRKKFNTLLQELTQKKNSESTLFCYDNNSINKIPDSIQTEILNQLKETIHLTLDQFTKEFQINIFSFKKALNEFCGINL
ncbi:MAG: hypothetical protein A2041_07820 [Bacteroidetes bacterium GWA2_31_9b]|nr:MAG: hypothetical protein A2041_07820 [Bacteroidetes bacterium GWA2_31_9b]